MMIIRKTNMDLLTGGQTVAMNAVQDDRYVRGLEVTLTAGGTAWTVPADVQILVQYRRSDGSSGCYDTLPNGEQAWSAKGNVLTVTLAPQMMVQPGPVNVWITLIRQEARLSTFAMVLNVQPCADAEETGEEYLGGISSFLPGVTGAAVGQFLQVTRVNGAGLVTGLKAMDLGTAALLLGEQQLTSQQKTALREKIGAAAAETGLKEVSQADEGKLLQVVDGVWTAVAADSSSVKNVVAEYIRSALEGDY